MKKEEAQEAVRKYGSQEKACKALHCSKRTISKALHGVEAQEDNRADVRVSSATGGFVLTGRRMVQEKPKDVWQARFYSLRKGHGYTLESLSDQWGNSLDTVRSKAKRFGSLRYIEDAENVGQYIACAVHPETPKGK